MALLTSSRLRASALLVGAGFLGFIALQFVRPALPNPPVVADLQAPAPVKQILTTSCYNCHSNETKLPWFDRIVPAYWLVVHDVLKGRRHLNFSDFGTLPAAQQKAFLYEAVNQMRLGAMPPANYTMIHHEAIVTPAQIAVLENYLHPADDTKPADAAQVAAANTEFQQWVAGKITPTQVAPALNGLAFPGADYQDWKPLSTTDRFDNGTMRVILGNPIAIQAVADNHVHPWPDGAAFAKISYKQQADDQGHIQTGQFIQVEFMVKDATKYASTEGWGFGRWKGDALKPYGKDASFAEECTSCHAPVKATDFVYTMPITSVAAPSDSFNALAALPGDLPHHPLEWDVITSSIDRSKGTMSTLYGNDPAIAHARTSPQTAYPTGAVLSLVTWQQQEDRHWFGGRIPGRPQSVEFVTVNPGGNGEPAYAYELYAGTPLQKAAVTDTDAAPRITALLNQRAAAMP